MPAPTLAAFSSSSGTLKKTIKRFVVKFLRGLETHQEMFFLTVQRCLGLGGTSPNLLACGIYRLGILGYLSLVNPKTLFWNFGGGHTLLAL